MTKSLSLFFFSLAFCLLSAEAHEATLPDITISERNDDLVGAASSATQGTVGSRQLKDRPTSRPGEVVETVPGMIITQHAGGGKANQYYLRGFNLDHGTDFAFYVDGVPINLTTHAHGQGYTDLNWLIPELVEGIDYKKGIYYPEQGDFGNTGLAEIRYFDKLPDNFVQGEAGMYGYGRLLSAGSPHLMNGHLLYAISANINDGPWATPETMRKITGVVKYSEGDKKAGFSVAAQGYFAKWRGVDQVPQRAIDAGLIDRFGSLDPSCGGDTHRVSVYGDWHRQDDSSSTKVTAYAVHYDLDLYSNFIYYVDQTNSDQFKQKDKDRIYAGFRAEHTIYGHLLGKDTENRFGFQGRHDWADVSLDRTNQRAIFQHIANNKVNILNLAPFYQNKTHWLEWFRTELGVRADGYYFDVNSDYPGNGGNKYDGTISPKATLVFGPWAKTEIYVQGGVGFRTNDARGVFTKTAPDTGLPSRELPAIVHARGGEIGVRTTAVKNLQSTVSYWMLGNNSDTFFAADSGSLVDSDRPSRRYGFEWTNYFTPLSWLTIDADFAYSWAYFTDDDPAGQWVPQAVTSVASGAISVKEIPGFDKFFASLRFRFFGPRPLVETNLERSKSVGVFNLVAGYELSKTFALSVTILNLFDSKYNDAEYFDVSRLKGEPAGPNADGSYDDHMVHAGDPFTARLALTARF